MIVSLPGEFGKPRPGVVVTDTRLNEVSETVIVAPLTTSTHGGAFIRVQVEPDEGNGLRQTSRIMTDKLHTVMRHRLREPVGQLGNETMQRLNEALRAVIGLRLDEEQT